MDSAEILRRHGIRPSAQRLAVADHVLFTAEHPSAEQVWERARRSARVLSRATVYSTLNLFVEKGLLRAFVVDGRTVFDPGVQRHHHLIDESGKVHDVPWSAVNVPEVRSLGAWEIGEYHLVLHGRRRRATGATRAGASGSRRPRRTSRGEKDRHV